MKNIIFTSLLVLGMSQAFAFDRSGATETAVQVAEEKVAREKAAEDARLAAEAKAKADEEARIAAEAKAAEDARRAEDVRRLAAAAAAEDARAGDIITKARLDAALKDSVKAVDPKPTGAEYDAMSADQRSIYVGKIYAHHHGIEGLTDAQNAAANAFRIVKGFNAAWPGVLSREAIDAIATAQAMNAARGLLVTKAILQNNDVPHVIYKVAGKGNNNTIIFTEVINLGTGNINPGAVFTGAMKGGANAPANALRGTVVKALYDSLNANDYIAVFGDVGGAGSNDTRLDNPEKID